MSQSEQQAIVTICLMAAFADGQKAPAERDQIKRVADQFSGADIDVQSLYQDVLMHKKSLSEVARALSTPEHRKLAYEMAVAVCDADGVANAAEQQFLEALGAELQLAPEVTAPLRQQADAMAGAALPAPADKPAAAASVNEAELDKSILNYAILNGALELMPESLATLTILPLQMKMVYRIGQRYGYQLDQGHVKDFLLTAGVGLTGQYVEGFFRKLLGGVLGGAGRQAASSGMAFATTYALGQAAKRYYSGGRTLDAVKLKELFASMLEQAKSMSDKYGAQIREKSKQINPSQLMALVKQG